MGSSFPTKGQWKFFFAKMGSSFPTKDQWKIFLAKMGSNNPCKGQWKLGIDLKWPRHSGESPFKG